MDHEFKKMMAENQRLLLENLELSRQNSKIIKKIQGHLHQTMIFKTLYWIIIIGMAIGAFYFIRPYVDTIVTTYNQTREYINNPTQMFNGFWEQVRGSSEEPTTEE